MATRFLDVLKTQGTHAVGNINDYEIKTYANGAICTENIDNFTLVEVGYDASTGEPVCSQLKNKANRGLLIASPETRHFEFEQMADFYNATGERARLVYLPEGTRFQTSAFSKNAGVTDITGGMVAHFDVTTKKFIVSAKATPHADFAGSANQFVVHMLDTDDEYVIDGQDLIQLVVIK